MLRLMVLLISCKARTSQGGVWSWTGIKKKAAVFYFCFEQILVLAQPFCSRACHWFASSSPIICSFIFQLSSRRIETFFKWQVYQGIVMRRHQKLIERSFMHSKKFPYGWWPYLCIRLKPSLQKEVSPEFFDCTNEFCLETRWFLVPFKEYCFLVRNGWRYSLLFYLQIYTDVKLVRCL